FGRALVVAACNHPSANLQSSRTIYSIISDDPEMSPIAERAKSDGHRLLAHPEYLRQFSDKLLGHDAAMAAHLRFHHGARHEERGRELISFDFAMVGSLTGARAA